MNRNDDLLNQALKTEQAGCRKDDTQCCCKYEKSMSREKFEYEEGKALNLPTNIIEQARKGDGYDHAFDSMNIMQPLNGWWHWWKAGSASMQSERDHLATQLADVVAENAAMKKAIPSLKMVHSFHDSWDDVSIAEEIGFNHAISTILRNLPQTPATVRFLAEQRAHGGAEALEKFAEFNIRSIDDTAPEYTENLNETARAARGFAAQLRNEVKG